MKRKGDAEIRHTLDRLRVLVDDPRVLLGIIDEIEELLIAKGDDYSGEDDAFSNFRLIAELSSQSVYKVFMTLLAVKIGRIFTLTKTNAVPKFESIWDTTKDLLGYLVLWLAYQQKEESNAIHSDSTD